MAEADRARAVAGDPWASVVVRADTAYVPADVAVSEHAAPGPHGPVRVRVYAPRGAVGALPALVWCHGGAWAYGDLDMPEADAVAREVAAAGAVVVSVDYRLAAHGVHYPVPLDDVEAAMSWAFEAAPSLGADPHRLHVGGASAGANLAAAAVLRRTATGAAEAARPRSLVLCYAFVHRELPPADPDLQQSLGRVPPTGLFEEKVMQAVIANYVGGDIDDVGEETLFEVAPGETPIERLGTLPPVLMVDAEFDNLRASSGAFARDLARAGVAVSRHVVRGVPHGHLNDPELAAARESYRTLARWVTDPT